MAVVVFTTAQVVWWAIFSVQQTRSEIERITEAYDRDRVAAERVIVSLAKAGDPSVEQPGEWLREVFPHLEWTTGVHPGRELAPGFPDYGVTVPADSMSKVKSEYDNIIRMFVGEVTIFLVILLTGAFMILRTLRREVQLMEKESNFLSAVTHELKSPIASIRLYVETMELRELPKEKQERFLAGIRQDLNRLETLVSNVLAAARLDASKPSTACETGDLARDAEELLNAWRDEVDPQGVTVEVENGLDPIPVRYDLHSLEVIIRNLLDNAVKYGGEPKKVQVSIERSDDNARIVVRDGGIGLERKEHDLIFDKFYRVGNEMLRNTKGTGLGLYLVRRLARNLGGDVTVDSEGVGKGSVFTVTLPIDRKAA